MHFKMKIIAVLADVFLKKHWSPYRKYTVIEPICILWKEPQNNPMNPPEAKVNSEQPCVTIPRWSPSGKPLRFSLIEMLGHASSRSFEKCDVCQGAQKNWTPTKGPPAHPG